MCIRDRDKEEETPKQEEASSGSDKKENKKASGKGKQEKKSFDKKGHGGDFRGGFRLSLIHILWGNPLYDWKKHKATGYAWWIQRMTYCMERYDVARIDHFRGFDEYYSIPYGDATAENGRWEKGPGLELSLIHISRSSLPTGRMTIFSFLERKYQET